MSVRFPACEPPNSICFRYGPAPGVPARIEPSTSICSNAFCEPDSGFPVTAATTNRGNSSTPLTQANSRGARNAAESINRPRCTAKATIRACVAQ